MDLSQFMPALQINLGDPIFIGAFFGFLLAIPLSLFAVFWLSAVTIKSSAAAVTGAFIGAFIGFLIILGVFDTLIFSTPMPHVDGGSTFFGAVLFCSATGLIGGIVTDILVARSRRSDYRRTEHVAAE